MGEYHLYDVLPRKNIACLDMHAFYVSCMALLENLDIDTVPMAVVGSLTQPGSVVLSANRPMKERFKIKTGNRRFEIPKHPDIKLFEPKMDFFIQMSVEITKLAATFVPLESIHVYSVDEFFISLDDVTSLLGDPETIVKSIQNAILQQFKVKSSAGLSHNILMSKLALDLEGKKTGFAQWTYEDIPEKLWKISPLSEMWGIGKRTEKKLNAMGIYRVGDLAAAI